MGCLIARSCATAGRFLNPQQTPVAGRWQPIYGAKQMQAAATWQPLKPATQQKSAPVQKVKKQMVKFGAHQQDPVQTQIDSLKQTADNVAKHHHDTIAAEIALKMTAAKGAIEAEIPTAAQVDTAEIGKDAAEAEKEVNDAKDLSTKKAAEAMEDLKDKTAKAVSIAAEASVGDVVKETE